MVLVQVARRNFGPYVETTHTLSIADVNGDGKPELLVGSDDFEIRHFRGEEVD